MLTAAQRARLVVVLVGARNPGNIGAAARAMQDFGFTDLRIVNPYAPPLEAAQLHEQANAFGPETIKSAVGAGPVLERARRFDDLLPAIEDCGLVVGTTAVGGRGLSRPVLALREAVHSLRTALTSWTEAAPLPAVPDAQRQESPRVALLFGSEKTGLTTEQLSFCSLLLTIPMYAPENARHLSMNLAQSVAVCLYELVRDGFTEMRKPIAEKAVSSTADDRERLLSLLEQVNRRSGYARRFPANSREHVLRQLIQSMASNHAEAVTWMGILKHALASMSQEERFR